MVKFASIALILLIYAVGLYGFFLFRSRHPDPSSRAAREKMGKILSGAFLFYMSVVLGLSYFIQGAGKTFSGEELRTVVTAQASNAGAQWHDIGTYEGFDYFRYFDAESEKGYRVKEGEIDLKERFLPVADPAGWTLLPW